MIVFEVSDCIYLAGSGGESSLAAEHMELLMRKRCLRVIKTIQKVSIMSLSQMVALWLPFRHKHFKSSSDF